MKVASRPAARAAPRMARFSATIWSAAASASAVWARFISNWPVPNSAITVSAGAPRARAAAAMRLITGSNSRSRSRS